MVAITHAKLAQGCFCTTNITLLLYQYILTFGALCFGLLCELSLTHKLEYFLLSLNSFELSFFYNWYMLELM